MTHTTQGGRRRVSTNDMAGAGDILTDRSIDRLIGGST